MSQDLGQARWQAVWRERGWQARVLWPVSCLYGLINVIRRALYARGLFTVHHLPVPVVVVGNVVVGGAGKTPTVLALLSHLKAQGWRPGVVSRGHGRQGGGVLEVRAETPAVDSGDEPALIKRSSEVPVFVGARRVEAARALLSAYPEVNLLLCDDGLQHLALGRDLSVAVFDSRGVGNGWLLPAGLLREPWPPRQHQPFQPDLILQQTAEGQAQPAPIPAACALIYQAKRRLADRAWGPEEQCIELHALRGTPLVAMAGIALPETFFEMLRERGLQLQQTLALPDHADNATLSATLQACSGTLICTEKDAVKLFPIWRAAPQDSRPQIWTIPLELRPDPGFFEDVDRRLTKLSSLF
ncbi:tetraacyldisaccharide 4'-kinase [Hydrogenophaga sp. PAMC20947]|uniref:tetraacyldisaccharide 4'-kinase n=1 Tax=Hydrogenophaga sp. PAMC20947 TaxID=2565558 RepID=UPI00109DE6AC|nr:tetraacyldisaccharide 4'-kinase [Hydrogenophaga sp. PAMC20947]QCB45324.1 tetraacyldisaccharide 4'-kinase [Hydrogenophaga sp. PAMC20947]